MAGLIPAFLFYIKKGFPVSGEAFFDVFNLMICSTLTGSADAVRFYGQVYWIETRLVIMLPLFVSIFIKYMPAG